MSAVRWADSFAALARLGPLGRTRGLRLARFVPSTKQVPVLRQSRCYSLVPVSELRLLPARRAPLPKMRCPPANLPPRKRNDPPTPPRQSCSQLHSIHTTPVPSPQP